MNFFCKLNLQKIYKKLTKYIDFVNLIYKILNVGSIPIKYVIIVINIIWYVNVICLDAQSSSEEVLAETSK